MNLTLTKQFAVTIQSSKPFRNLKLSNSSEHLYLISRRQRISEVSSSGKLRKLLIPRKESKILASGISECSNLIAGLISTGQVIICSKQKKIFQSFLLPPQIKLSIEILKPEHCSLYIFNKGLVLIAPNDQVWLWKSDECLNDPMNLAPHLKGTWVNLNSSSMLKGRSEANSWRSNISESRPSSNSSRPPTFKSRFTTHSYSTRAGWDYVRGSLIGVLRVWLRGINEDSCVLESRFLYINLANHNKSGVLSTSVVSAEEFVFKGTLEFWSKKGQKDMGLISKLDHSSSLAAIGVNSSHPYFCQLVFLNPMTGTCTTRKLCNYVTVEDIPTTSTDGQTSFWIDDISWSPDDNFLAVAFKSGFVSIFNRVAEPISFVLDMRSSSCENKIFSYAFFTTDPEVVKKFGAFLSVDWTDKAIVISDGYTICELGLNKLPMLKDLIPLIMPNEVDGPDISINISHETNPIPSEIDSGPKKKNIEQAFILLRSCWSNSHSLQSKESIFSITSWISNVLPPQLHEEINYTSMPNSRFETESRLANGLILKKKVHAIDIYRQFSQIIEMEKWSLVHNSDLQEWILSVAYQVFKYMIADQQALYAWNVLKLFERWIGFKLQRIRNMLVIYSLIQYRNHQANHINVVYFLLAYAVVRGQSQNSLPVLNEGEEEFLRIFIKMNVEPVQSDPKIEGINGFYYLASRIKEKVDSSLNYLLGYSSCFVDNFQEICLQLIKGNMKYVESYISVDTMIIFAYFFDFNENLFISPVEAAALFSQSFASIAELIEMLKKLSQVVCNKDKKLQKDAAFIYWTLRVYWKLESLLPVDQAFYAINKLIPFLDEKEITEALTILKKLFSKDDALKLLDLCHKDTKPFFQQYALELVKDRLKQYIQTIETQKIQFKKSSICEQVYSKYSSDELAEILVSLKMIIGEIQVRKDKTENWLELEYSNFAQGSDAVVFLIQEILKFLWYLHILENIQDGNCIDWRLRLLGLTDLVDKQSTLEGILSEGLEFTVESKNVIALYLRTSMFPISLQAKYLNWIENLKQNSESSHILHSLEQPGYVKPWTFDLCFLNFIEKFTKLSTGHATGTETASKSWNTTVKILSKQYKISGFYRYNKKVYTEVKENSETDFSLFESIFNQNINISLVNEQRTEKKVVNGFTQQKKRCGLEVVQGNIQENKGFCVQELVGVKRMVYVLKVSLKRVFFGLKAKKVKNSEFLMQKSSAREGFYFFMLKAGMDVDSAVKVVGLKFMNILESQQKPAKHRRIQSVILPSVSVQKPFQLIRVQKSRVE